MGFLSWMWLAVLKIHYRKQIKELQKNNKGMTKREALFSIAESSNNSRLKKLVAKDKRVTVQIIIQGIILLFILLTFIAVIVFGILLINGMTSWVSIFDSEEDEMNSSVSSQFDWGLTGKEDDKTTNDGDSPLDGSGGAYPKDPQLKKMAQFLEILENTANNASKGYNFGFNFKIEPGWILGLLIRESSNQSIDAIYNGSINIMKDLVYNNPSCNKGSQCLYMQNRVSHFVGGSVSGGKDRGDPRTQKPNTDSSLYGRYAGAGGHALSFGQFEITSIPSEVAYKYLEDSKSAMAMDNNLGFIRPNAFYLPDGIWCSTKTFLNFINSAMRNNNIKSVINSSEFQSLSDVDKSYILFCIGNMGYGGGTGAYTDANAVNTFRDLIKLAKSGKLDRLDNMIYNANISGWVSAAPKIRSVKPGHKAYVTKLKSIYPELTAPYPTQTWGGGRVTYRETFWYGTFYGAHGQDIYRKMKDLVNKAEKEEGSGDNNPGATSGEYSFTSGKLFWPVGRTPGDTTTNRITSLYGYRPSRSGKHNGVDFGRSLLGASNDPIYAVADGVVVEARFSSTAGYVMIVKHEESSGTYYSIYMHGLANSFKFKKGDSVKAGQEIMQMGNTGASQGKHLHLEFLKAPIANLYDHSKSIDPMPYYKHLTYKTAPGA